jgi:hypothetical protein
MDLTPTGTTDKRRPLMDDIMAVRDGLLNEQQLVKAEPVIPGELSEAFTLLDPDLAMLHKDMKSAAAQLNTAIDKGHMIDMAKWRFESAQSAYQTRLVEIKKDKALNKLAEQSVNGETDLERAKRDMRNMAMQEAMNESFARRRKQKAEEKRREDEKQGGLFFYLMLGLWFAQMQQQNRTREMKLSKMQNDFFNARTA